MLCYMCVCVMLVCSTSDIGFNSSASAITVNNQLAKDIDQYFKTKLHVEDSLPPKVGTYFTEWAEQTRRATARQKFNIYRGRDLNPQPLDINTANSRRGQKTPLRMFYSLTACITTYIIIYSFHCSCILCLFM